MSYPVYRPVRKPLFDGVARITELIVSLWQDVDCKNPPVLTRAPAPGPRTPDG